MDKGMHIRRGKICLFIPRCRRQNNVGIERVARHAEIERDEEVELALERSARLRQLLLLPPFDFPRVFFRIFLLENAILRAEEIFQEVIVAFCRRTEQITAPDKEVAWEILGSVRILPCEFEALVLEALDDVVLDPVKSFAACGGGFVGDLLTALVERRMRKPWLRGGGGAPQPRRAARIA